MTDKHEEKLNSAIDSVLAGDPASGADVDTLALARLASHLRGMPSPQFKSRLAAELFPQQRRPFLWRITVLSRIKQIASRRIAAPLAITGAIAAVALAVFVYTPFGNSDGGTAEAFGTLPVPQDTAASPIQGGTGTITWQLDPNLILPDSAPAFRLAMPEVTAARAEQIAQAIGVSGSAQPVDDGSGGVAGYHVGAALDCKPIAPGDACGASFDMWTSGWFSYRSGVYASAYAPDDATAKAAASGWIERSGVTNGDSFELTIQPPPVFPDKPEGIPNPKEAPTIAQVIAQPTGHSGPDSGPVIFLSVAGDGSITDAGGFWAKIVGESDYRLHDKDALLADLEALRGSFATLEAEFGDVAAADVTQDAVATIANVQLTYRQATPTGDEAPDQVYLVPVYTVKTSLSQDGHDVAGFATWIPATGPAR